MNEREKYILESFAVRIKDYAVSRAKDVARGAETPKLSALLLQKYALGFQNAVAVIFDENRAAVDYFETLVDVDAEVAKIDSEWRENAKKRWSFRPADIVEAQK